MKKQFLSFFCLFALQSSNLSLDPYLSPYTGADFILTTTQALIEADDSIDSFKQEPAELLGKIGAGTYRFGKMGLIWGPYGQFADTWQHEFFGHGFRFRSSDSIWATTYHVDLPPPYGYGGGWAGYHHNENCKIVTLNAVAFGGTEAETVLAIKLREFFFETDQMDGRFAPLYARAQQGLSYYIAHYNAHIGLTEMDWSGHDISVYLESVNALNPTTPINGEQLANISAIAILDPFFWTAIISEFNYIIFGEKCSAPTFTIDPVRFSASVFPNLTPAGPEIIFDQYLSVGTTPFKTYVRWTPLLEYKSWGAGFKCTDLVRYNGFRIGCIADGWFAKRLSKITIAEAEKGVYDPTLTNPSRRPGFQLMATLRHPLEFNETMLLGLDLGYKTEGYLIGAPLKSTLVSNLVFSMDF